jgi:hypothetical protein
MVHKICANHVELPPFGQLCCNAFTKSSMKVVNLCVEISPLELLF